MPATALPAVLHYIPAPATSEEMDWAEFPIIDLSKAKTSDGRAELAPIVRDAMRTCGFLYVINHGLTQAQNERLTDIADVPFSQVPGDEQREFTTKIAELGSLRGYKHRQCWMIDNGVRDQNEHYNMHRSLVSELYQKHPKAMQPFLPELRAFAEFNHYEVLHPILRLLSRGLELPEETFVDIHGFETEGETYLRFMKYYPRSEDEENRTNNVWFKRHTDSGTLSILWSQPVTALQILAPDGQWRYVKHIPNGLVVNCGDVMEMLSGGFYKAAIHRVCQPPPAQRGHTRLGMFYFVHADDNVKLVPFAESPVLQRVGITRKWADADAPTPQVWRAALVKVYGRSDLLRGSERVDSEEVVLQRTGGESILAE